MWQRAEPGATPGRSRRQALLLAAGWLAMAAKPAAAHPGGAAGAAGAAAATAQPATPGAPRGLVVPRQPAPDWTLTDNQSRATSLASLLAGHVSAVQLMFAGCSATCPTQGAVFAAAARQLQRKDVRFLSLTVDPLGDSPQALQSWLQRFGAHPAWSAAAPRFDDVQPLAGFLRGLPAREGTHSSQVFLFDRQGRLAFRTVDLPTAAHVADLLQQLATV